MSKISRHDEPDSDRAQPVEHDQHRGRDPKKQEADAHLRRAEAALREQPEDRRDTARQTTPAGKGRSR